MQPTANTHRLITESGPLGGTLTHNPEVSNLGPYHYASCRRQFILDLQAWVEHLIDSRHDIILSMGAIASYDPDSSATAHPLVFHPGIPILDKQHDGKLSTLIASCRLVEPLARQHSSRPFPPSHDRGSE